MAAVTAIATVAFASWLIPHVRVVAILGHTELPFPPIIHCRNCGLHYFRDAQLLGSPSTSETASSDVSPSSSSTSLKWWMAS